MIRKGTNMGFGYIFAGLVFFANPCVNIFDIFPDILGCILLTIGLFKLSDVDGRFYYARKSVYYMYGIFALKLILSVYCTVRWQDLLSSFTMCFSVAEIIVFIYFFGNLFGGIEYTVTRNTSGVLLKDIGIAKSVSVVFVICKSILVFLPELLSILSSNSEEAGGLVFTAALRYKPYAILLCLILTLALGIYFIRVNYTFFQKLRKDKEYTDAIFGIYKENVLDNPRLLKQRHSQRAFAILILSVICLFDITIDGINLLPDTLGYLLLCFSSFFIIKKKDTRALACAVSLVALSIAEYVFRLLTNLGVNFSLGYGLALSKDVSILSTPVASVISVLLSISVGALYITMLALCTRNFNTFASSNGIPEVFNTKKTVVLNVLYVSACTLYDLCPVLSAYINELFRKTDNMAYFSKIQTVSNIRYCTLFALVLLWALVLRNILRAGSKMKFRL